MIERIKYRELPLATGVYFFLDKNKKIIYVGKALSLRKRVSSYFSSKMHDSKTVSLVKQIAFIDFVIAASEKDALILEHDLIKRYRPKFNILLKDNKYFPYIAISKEDWPRLYMLRRSFSQLKKISKTASLYGPYPNVKAARATLDFLYRHFSLRSCDGTVFANRSRGCMKYQIGHCSAPCVSKISAEDYNQLIKLTKQFLSGKKTGLIDHLVEKMSQASESKHFESAAHYRDLIKHLRATQSQQTMRDVNFSIDLYLVLESVTYISVGLVALRDGVVSATYVDEFDKCDWRSMPVWFNIVSHMQKYMFSTDSVTDELVFVANGDYLESLSSGNKAFGKMTKSSLKHWYDFLMSQITFKSLVKKQDTKPELFYELGLVKSKIWAVSIDISHNQGSQRVASCASWHMNSPSKDGMQLFKLSDQNNDVDAMRQVAERLAKRWQKNGKIPDLMIIDGGKGQINAVSDSFKTFLSQSVVLSIAKGPKRIWGQEKIFRLNNDLTVSEFAPSKMLLDCLLFIRDLAHKHAINFHRKRIQKTHNQTLLRAIEGVGPEKERSLINGFGGLQGLKKASVEQLTSVKGINSELALRIYNALH